LRVDEDLRLPLQPPERLRVHEAVAVSLKRGSDAARFLWLLTPPALERSHGEGREQLLLLSNAMLEAQSRPIRGFHVCSVVALGAPGALRDPTGTAG